MSSSVLCVIKIRANCGCLMPCITRGVPCPASGKWLGSLGFCFLQEVQGPCDCAQSMPSWGPGRRESGGLSKELCAEGREQKGSGMGWMESQSSRSRPKGAAVIASPGGWIGFIQMDTASREGHFWLWSGSRSSLGTVFILLSPAPV